MQDQFQTGPSFKSKEAKYVLFNFHREKNLAAMTAVLQSASEEPQIVILAGENGCGRRYFLETALYRARSTGERIQRSVIDLDGYELGKDSLEKYVLCQIAKRTARGESRASEILEQSKLKVTLQGPHLLGISLVSIALGLDLPLKDAMAELGQTFENIPGPERGGREGLSRLIRRYTETGKLVLHVLDSAEITTILRGWLLDEAEVNRNLVLVFSCTPADRNEAVAPSASEAIRFEVTALDKQELHLTIDERFSPNSFPDWFHRALWDYSGGVPGRIAIKMADLLGDDFLVQDVQTGAWHLSDDDPSLSAVAQEFTADAYEPIRKVLSELPAVTAERLKTFLQLSALCGDKIPVGFLLRHTMLPEQQWDEFLDLIDDHFPGNSLFEDLGYGHPGFSGELVYSFSNPVLRSAMLEHIRGPKRSSLARNLLSFLQENLPVRTRGVARLFLEIARHLDSDRERERYEQELAWWIGVDEAQEFSKYLHKAVRGGRFAPVVIFNEVGRNWRIRWPPYKSLAILDALVADDPEAPILPIELLGRFYCLRAWLHHDCALYAEALDDASFGLSVSEGQPLVEASLHEILGLIKMDIGNYKEALHHLNRTRAIRERDLGPADAAVGTILNNLATCYWSQGEYAEAAPLHQRSLAISERAFGPDHPYVAGSLTNLATCFSSQGKYAEAAPLYQRSLGIIERVLGPEHPDVAGNLHCLAVLYSKQGKYAEAAPLYQRSVAIWEMALGPDHPQVAGSLHGLAVLYTKQGKYAEAAPLYQRSLAIWEMALGPDHSHVADSLNGLAVLCDRQGKYAEAAPLFQRSLAIREKALGPDHPDVAESLNNLAVLYDRQGKYAEAAPLFQRSLAIREKALGPDHPDVAESLNNLAALYTRQGKYAEAAPLYQRSLAISERALGPDHPEVASILTHLASLYSRQGKYAEAAPLYQRSLAIIERALGPDHPRARLLRSHMDALRTGTLPGFTLTDSGVE